MASSKFGVTANGFDAFRLNIMTGQMQQVLGPFKRFLQCLISLVRMGSPLHGKPSLSIACIDKPIRMHPSLNIAVARIKI